MVRYTVLLLCVCVTHCVATAIYSEVGKYAEEENFDNNILTSVLHEELEKGSPDIVNSHEKTDSSSSSEDVSSEEVKKNIESSESSSSSQSSESKDFRKKSDLRIKKRRIFKRSLETKQDSVNSLGINSTQIAKDGEEETNSGSTTVQAEIHNEEIAPESTPQNNGETTTESESASTTETNNEETTTESKDQTTEAEIETTETSVQTTEAEQETTTETDIETTENTESTTESEQESTTEAVKDLNANQDLSTTEKVSETPTSEDSEELPYYSPSSTTTEVAPPPEDTPPKTMTELAMDRVNKLSDQIRLILSTYKKAGVVVVPGQSFFPDPMPMQDFRQSLSVGTMDFKNMNVYGLSKFTVEHINTDVDRMQVYILLHMKKLTILGNYTLRSFFSRAAGPFNVTLLDVDSQGVAEIQTAAEGHLEAADSEMDMFTKDMKIDFKNMGFMGSMFQGMVGVVGDAVFNSIKPQILERVNLVIRTDVNKKLKEFSTKFVNKVNPVDLAFSEGRRYCKAAGYDPYHIKDHTFLLGGLVYVNITDFWVEGLSRFHRVGNLSLSMDSGVIEIGVHVMTGKLTGHCQWSGQTFGIVENGRTNFTVDHLQVRALVHQSLDVRKKPQLNDLDLELGWVRVTMNSPMTLNLMIEGIVNAFPRLLRHIIVDTLELPLKEKVQEILDKINVESIVDDNLPRLDTFGL